MFLPPIYLVSVKALKTRSASSWRQEDLEGLKISFEECNLGSFLATFEPSVDVTAIQPSDRANSLIKELAKIGPNLPAVYKTILTPTPTSNENKWLKLALVKATYLVGKYADHESIVDSLVQLLLDRIGFNEDWLYAFPQLNLNLCYGEQKCTAKADFAILHVLSFYRMAVVEDKRKADHVLNSEPQLIAEAIAMSQANVASSRKRGSDEISPAAPDSAPCSPDAATEEIGTSAAVPTPANETLFGVRVNGLHFFFYSIPVSDAVLDAMRSVTEAQSATVVSRLYSENGQNYLDWTDGKERKTIIQLLDWMRDHLLGRGSVSARRPSLSHLGKSFTDATC